jgi:hypothetical protein
MATTPGFYLVWDQGTGVLIGKVNGVFQENEAVQGISFPSQQTIPINVRLASCARDIQSFDTLRNVKLYLTGDPTEIATVQTIWPPLGGGFYISYDGGKTYTVFSPTYGYENDPTTWVLLPAEAIGLNGVDGTLGPFDSANLILKYVIPEQATQYQIYDIALTADFDVA